MPEKEPILSAQTKVRSVFICLCSGISFGMASVVYPNVNLAAIYGFLLGWLGLVLGVTIADFYRGGKS